MKKIGILGGGQLSQLLSLRAKNLKTKIFVLSPSPQDPSAQVNPLWIKGDPNKLKDLKNFLKLVDILTFESEFFSAQQIKKALQSLKGKKPLIAPSLKALSLIQDRLTQKKLLSQYKIPTADFVKIDFNLEQQLVDLNKKWGGLVLKTRMGGYDGYGTFIMKNSSQIKKFLSLHQSDLSMLYKPAKSSTTDNLRTKTFIAEKFIPFKRELALLSARNKKKQIVFFPLVESFQKDSRCLWVKGPVQHKKLTHLKKQIKVFLNKLDYQGLLAFELFDTGKDLIVNELAPRVHNSGHYSLSALDEDQFTMHLKAILNQPLKKPKLKSKAFAMLNLLGESKKQTLMKKSLLKIDSSKSQNKSSQQKIINSLKKQKNKKQASQKQITNKILDNKIHLNKALQIQLKKEVYLYWYGKKENRKGRKMGHLNSLADSFQKALNELLNIRKGFNL